MLMKVPSAQAPKIGLSTTKPLGPFRVSPCHYRNRIVYIMHPTLQVH
jgi:hypothetical protein